MNLDQRSENVTCQIFDILTSTQRNIECAARTDNRGLVLMVMVRDSDVLKDLTMGGILSFDSVRGICPFIVLKVFTPVVAAACFWLAIRVHY